MKHLEFELAYLSRLTREGIKPLSRWERNFSSAAEKTLRATGLRTRVVERALLSGATVRELLFGSSEQCLDSYVERFDRKPITGDPDSARDEGLLFGYPKCCVESYVANGYARNALRRRDQRILFHWACPGCAVTPLLLPQYRRVYRACRAATRGRAWRVIPSLLHALPVAGLRPGLAAAVSLAALGLAPALTRPAAAAPVDPHVNAFSLADDADGDFLTSIEEFALGLNPAITDQNTNGVPDGVDLARVVACEIAGLPTTPSSNQVYRLDFMLRGLEWCQVCGTNVNMGHLTIYNPQAHLSADVPYIALHFLEHDSFWFAGDLHGTGRSSVQGLVDVLFRAAVSIDAEGQQVTLRWMARAGRSYQVFTAPDLRGPWASGPIFQGDGTEQVFTESNPAGATQRFFKVVVW